MGSPPPNSLRFLPILTEVVEPPESIPSLAGAAPLIADSEPVAGQPDQGATQSGLSEEMQVLVSHLVDVQLERFRVQMFDELQSMARQAIAEAMVPH